MYDFYNHNKVAYNQKRKSFYKMWGEKEIVSTWNRPKIQNDLSSNQILQDSTCKKSFNSKYIKDSDF